MCEKLCINIEQKKKNTKRFRTKVFTERSLPGQERWTKILHQKNSWSSERPDQIWSQEEEDLRSSGGIFPHRRNISGNYENMKTPKPAIKVKQFKQIEQKSTF